MAARIRKGDTVVVITGADKGKGRAEPEPEPVESILIPTFLITESDEEDGDVPAIPPEAGESLVSPTDL